MEKLELPIEDLTLDIANPRLGGVATQNDAMRGLIGLGVSYFKTLMLSIRENGLDPGDSFYVLRDEEDEGSYIVVDGNRRLAALKVLAEPVILTGLDLTDSQLKLLSKVAADFDAAEFGEVNCVLFEDRATADAWIERRHGRDLGGEGRVTWSPLEIERFQKDRSTLDVIDFVERGVGAEREDWTAVRSAVEKNSSTLRRFLSSKTGRQWLGYSVGDDDENGGRVPAFSRNEAAVLEILETIFADIANGEITSRSYNTADDIDRYFARLPKKLIPQTGEARKTKLFRDAIPRQTSSTRKVRAATASARTRAKGPRSTLAGKKHEFRQPETAKGQRLVAEASRLRVAEYPLASAYLLRAFLEHTVDSYMVEHEIPRVDGKMLLDLNNRAVRVMDHLHQTKRVSQTSLRGAKRVLTNTSDPSSIQALNDYHHDRYQVPAADALRNGWDSCVPLFVAVWGSPA
nr:hypothetical protein [Brevundimonas naejangsanensis]